MDIDFAMTAAKLVGTLSLLAAAIATIRLIRGPSQADRVVALDIFLACAIAFCIAVALMTQRDLFLDVAIGLAIAGFIATIGWARLIEATASKKHNEKEKK